MNVCPPIIRANIKHVTLCLLPLTRLCVYP